MLTLRFPRKVFFLVKPTIFSLRALSYSRFSCRYHVTLYVSSVRVSKKFPPGLNLYSTRSGHSHLESNISSLNDSACFEKEISQRLIEYESENTITTGKQTGKPTEELSDECGPRKKIRSKKVEYDNKSKPVSSKRKSSKKAVEDSEVKLPPGKKSGRKTQIKIVSEATTDTSDLHEEIPLHKLDTKSKIIRYLSSVFRRTQHQLKPKQKQRWEMEKRINVIDTNLCDLCVERLARPLEEYSGCDILDLNPGTGIWSSKLHDLLKPRSHLLVEPQADLYMPFLKPLTEVPKSTYRLIPVNGISWNQLEKVLSKDYLPNQQKFELGDPRLNQINKTLLVTANVGSVLQTRVIGQIDLGAVVLYQFMCAVRTHALFHQYGKIRMLMWMNPLETKVVPKNVANIKKKAFEAMASCEHIEIIADGGTTYHSREKTLDLKSLRIVLNRMEKNGIRIPEERETPLLKSLKAGVTGLEIEELSPKNLQHRFKKMQDDFNNGAFQENESIEITTPRGRGFKKTAEYLQMVSLSRQCQRRTSKTLQLFELADRHESILDCFRRSRIIINPDEAKKKLAEAEAMTFKWKKVMASLSSLDTNEALYISDNRRVFNQIPPLLYWDRRSAEPIQVNLDDFYPNNNLCLVDFKPRTLPFLPEDPEFHDIFTFISLQFLFIPSQTVKQALTSLAPGALEWLASQCPSLTDPLKGGCPDLDLVTSRCITMEMLQEICIAWKRWPFKPTRSEVLYRLSSESFDVETE